MKLGWHDALALLLALGLFALAIAEILWRVFLASYIRIPSKPTASGPTGGN